MRRALGLRPPRSQAAPASTADQLLSAYVGCRHYRTLCALAGPLVARPATKLIAPFPGLAFGDGPSVLTSVLGEPQLRLSPSNTVCDQLLFYRMVIAGYRVRCEFHFARSGLFYARRSFRETDELSERFILSSIRSKYLDNGAFDQGRDKVLDQQGNLIIYKREIYSDVHYLSGQALLFPQTARSLSDIPATQT